MFPLEFNKIYPFKIKTWVRTRGFNSFVWYSSAMTWTVFYLLSISIDFLVARPSKLEKGVVNSKSTSNFMKMTCMKLRWRETMCQVNHVTISKRICLGVDPKSILAGLPYELGNSKIPNLWIAVKGDKSGRFLVRINHSITELWQRLSNSIKN